MKRPGVFTKLTYDTNLIRFLDRFFWWLYVVDPLLTALGHPLWRQGLICSPSWP